MKHTLKITLLWAIALLFGCQKPQESTFSPVQPQSSAGNFDYKIYHGPDGKTGDVLATDLFYNNLTDSIMDQMGLPGYADSTIQYYADSADQVVIYTKRLSYSEETQTSLDLFIVSSNDNMSSLPVTAETRPLDNGNRQCTFTSFMTGTGAIVVVVDSRGEVVSVNGSPVQTSVGGTGGSAPCSQSTSNYKDCFKCSWGQLTEDAFGTLTCSLNPVMCLMACGISCAMFPVPPSGHSPYTYPEIKSSAASQISYGKYSGVSCPSGGKEFIFLY